MKVRIGHLAFAVCVFAAGFVGCGSDDRNDGQTARVAFAGDAATKSSGSVESCLRRGGASFARSPRQLQFLARAERNGEVAKPTIAVDKVGKVTVRVWTKSRFENQPPEWVMWIGQPQGDALSPAEIVGAGLDGGGYVAYIKNPSRRVRARTEACIKAPADEGPPATMLDREDIEDGKPE